MTANNGKVNFSTQAGQAGQAGRGCALLTALLISALCVPALAADFQAGLEAVERGDTQRRCVNFVPWPSRITRGRKPCWVSCTPMAGACRRTMPKP